MCQPRRTYSLAEESCRLSIIGRFTALEAAGSEIDYAQGRLV
jgi:hypothetical protein